MVKPTFIQSLLGRPSQSYSFPHQKDYYSSKSYMRGVAQEASNGVVVGDTHSTTTTMLVDPSHVHSMGNLHPRPESIKRDSSDESIDIFYTPKSSPRSSVATTATENGLSTTNNDMNTNDSTIATRTPLPGRSLSSYSNSSSMSTNSLDGHSLFSSDSTPSTELTSDHGDAKPTTTKKVSRSNSSSTSSSSTNGKGNYTDQDWAKDVRWLASPSQFTSTSNSNGKRRTTRSASVPYTPRIPSPLSSSTTAQPVPPPRKKSTSKSTSSIMMSMTALLEEDEDSLTAAYTTTTSSVLIHPTSSPPRTRTSSSPNHHGVKRSGTVFSSSSTSTSTRRRNSTKSSPNLARRKSRSLEDLSKLADEEDEPEPSSSSPSIPSYGTPGYTSLTLPRAPQPPTQYSNNNNKRLSTLFTADKDGKVDLTKSGMAQTTMASVEITKGLGRDGGGGRTGFFSSLLGGKSTSSSSSGVGGKGRAKGKSTSPLSFTSYRKPPDYVPEGSVLVQVWAVGVDGVDARLAGVSVLSEGREREKGRPVIGRRSFSENAREGEMQGEENASGKATRPTGGLMRTVSMASRRKGRRSSSDDVSGGGGSYNTGKTPEPGVGFVPGRSFVGRVLECGWEVRQDVVRKGEWVVGLLDIKKSGALQEFIIVDRHRIFRIHHPDLPPSALADTSASHSDRTRSESSSASSSSTQTPRTHPHTSRYPVYTPSTPSTLNSLSRSASSASASSRFGTSRHTSHKANSNDTPRLTLEELALLPLCGVQAYRAIRTFAFAFQEGVGGGGSDSGGGGGRRRRALVLQGHDGVGAMATQMLAKKGWRVTVHASLPLSCFSTKEEGVEEHEMKTIEDRVRRWGAEEVIFDDGERDGEGDEGRSAVVRCIEQLIGDGDVFDAVLDTIGGREIWEVGERLLRCGVNRKKEKEKEVNNKDVGVGGGGLKRGFGSLRIKSSSGGGSGGNTTNHAKEKERERGMGQFTTLFGDFPGRVIPSASDHFKAGLRSMKNNHHHTSSESTHNGVNGMGTEKVGGGKVGYAWVSIAQDVDWEGHDVRDGISAVVKMAVEDGVRPWVGLGAEEKRVVMFERAPDVFMEDGTLAFGGTAVVKVVA